MRMRTLGACLAAALAIAAGASAAAQASDHLQCKDGSGSCEIRVTQHPNGGKQIFTTGLGAVECDEFHATYKGPATVVASATLGNVEYEGDCTFAGVEAEVDFDGCDYTLASPIETVEGHGQGAIVLGPEGCEVRIVAGSTAEPVCEISVPGGQTFENAITYTEVETEGVEEVTGHTSTEEINYAVSGECVGGGEVPLEGGTYESTFTMQAYEADACTSTRVDLSTAET